jgi:hypothetical protein
MNIEGGPDRLTPRQIGGAVWAKYVIKWLLGLAVAAVLVVVLAIPLAFSLFGLLPLGIVALVCAVGYIAWRLWWVRHGHEEVDDGTHVELVGGRALRELREGREEERRERIDHDSHAS